MAAGSLAGGAFWGLAAGVIYASKASTAAVIAIVIAAAALVMMGTFQWNPWVAAISSLGILLSAVYILLLYQRVFTGPAPGESVVDRDGAPVLEGTVATRRSVRDLVGREKAVVAPLLALIVLLGVYPSLALRVINPSVEQTLSIVGVQDPAPAVDSSHAVEGSAK